MTLTTSPRFQLWYNGTPAEKLAQARLLRQEIGAHLLADVDFMQEIEELRSHCQAPRRRRRMRWGVWSSLASRSKGRSVCP